MFPRMPITNFNYHLRSLFSSFIFTYFYFYLRKRENEFFFDLKIVILIESEEMMILFRKKNHLNFICTKVEETNYARFDNLFCLWMCDIAKNSQKDEENPCFPGLENSNTIFRLNLPCPRVFLRSLRQLKFVVSYPRHVSRFAKSNF